jgi:hypothetical protein
MDLIIGLNDVRRKLEQTACDDHNVILDPGVYSVRFLTVDGKPTEPDNAYWVVASIPCTRVRNGARYGKAGERSTYPYQVYSYKPTSNGR